MSTDDDRIRQMQGALHLLQTGIDRGSRRVEEMHLAISKKPFAVLRHIPVVSLVAGVVEKVHDGVTHGVHKTLRTANEFALGTAIHALEFAKMDGPLDEEPPAPAPHRAPAHPPRRKPRRADKKT
ncbi:MAG: hypothetical protein NVS9B10_24340 [Nevskia sp.]